MGKFDGDRRGVRRALVCVVVCAIACMACQGDDRRPRPGPGSVDGGEVGGWRCGQLYPSTRTVQVAEPSTLTFRAQCEVAGVYPELLERLPQLELDVVGAQVANAGSFALQANGTLTVTAEVTSMAPSLRSDVQNVSITEPAFASPIASGSLFMHDSEATLRARFAGAVGGSCFVTCRDGRGRARRTPFEGAICSCDPPQLLKFGPGYTELHTTFDSGMVTLTRVDRLAGESPRSQNVSARLGVSRGPYSRQELSIVESESGAPFALWWGVGVAPDVSLDAVLVPISEAGFGEPRSLALDAFAGHSMQQLVSMELLRDLDPDAAPHPLWLYTEQGADGSLSWRIAELFSGPTGLGVTFSTPSETWVGLRPEAYAAGAAFAGYTRTSSAARLPRRGVDLDSLVSWALSRSETDPERVILRSVEAGSVERGVEFLASPWRHCWGLGPAPGGFVLAERPRVEAAGREAQAYFVSAIAGQLALAPLQDAHGRRVGGVFASGVCAPSTPSTWPAVPDWEGEQGRAWLPLRRPGVGLAATWVGYDLSGSSGVDAGRVEAISPRFTLPMISNADSTPAAAGLVGWSARGAVFSGLSRALGAETCSAAACASVLATVHHGGFVAYDLGLAYAGDRAAELALLVDGVPDPTARLPLADVEVAAENTWALTDGVPQGLLTLVDDGADLKLARLEQGQPVTPRPLRLQDGSSPMAVFAGDRGGFVWISPTTGGDVQVAESERSQLVDAATGPLDFVVSASLGVVEGLPPGERSSLRAFSATAPASPVVGSLVQAARGARWAAWVEDGSTSCPTRRLLIHTASDSLETRLTDPPTAMGEDCGARDRAVAMGDFLGTGGQQWLSVRRGESDLALRIWYLGSEGLEVRDLGSIVLPPQRPEPRIWVGDLDSDGLTDVFVDLFDADGVLVGLSDGAAGTRGGFQRIEGVSRRLTPTPGSAPHTASGSPIVPTHDPAVTLTGRLTRL